MNVANLRTDRLSLFQGARNPAGVLARRRTERQLAFVAIDGSGESSAQRVPA